MPARPARGRLARRAGVVALALVAPLLLGAVTPARAQEQEQVEHLEPDGSKNGYPLYKVVDDGRHLPPLGTATEGARAAITLVHAGVRYYGYLTVPPNPQAEPLPVIVTLHGVKQSTAEHYMRMQGAASARRYVTFDLDEHGGSWNAGRCCGVAVERGYDSTGGVFRLLEELAHAHDYARDRLYVAGFSNGGMLAYRMACERPGFFAAMAVVAAAHVTECRPVRPVPVLHVHGTGDGTVPYAGTSYSASLKTRIPSARQTTDLWRRENQRAGATTTLKALQGVGHLWPTKANSGYDASGQIQEFLLKRRLR